MPKKVAKTDPLGTLFAQAAEQAKLPSLFVQSEGFALEVLSKARGVALIDGFIKKREKEDPINPETLFYIRGIKSKWRYAHTRKGRVRTAEKAQTDYHMSVYLNNDQSVLIKFTTSQHAYVAKKLNGFTKGTTELIIRDAKDLNFKAPDAEKFIQAVAGFLSHHAEILHNKVEKQKRTIEFKENLPQAIASPTIN